MQWYEHVARSKEGETIKCVSARRRPGRSADSGNAASLLALSSRFADSTPFLIDLCAISDALHLLFSRRIEEFLGRFPRKYTISWNYTISWTRVLARLDVGPCVCVGASVRHSGLVPTCRSIWIVQLCVSHPWWTGSPFCRHRHCPTKEITHCRSMLFILPFYPILYDPHYGSVKIYISKFHFITTRARTPRSRSHR